MPVLDAVISKTKPCTASRNFHSSRTSRQAAACSLPVSLPILGIASNFSVPLPVTITATRSTVFFRTVNVRKQCHPNVEGEGTLQKKLSQSATATCLCTTILDLLIVLRDSARSSRGCPIVLATDATTNIAPRSGKSILSKAPAASGRAIIFLANLLYLVFLVDRDSSTDNGTAAVKSMSVSSSPR